MSFQSLKNFFSGTPKEHRHHLPANSNGHDQTSEFRAFLFENVQSLDQCNARGDESGQHGLH